MFSPCGERGAEYGPADEEVQHKNKAVDPQRGRGVGETVRVDDLLSDFEDLNDADEATREVVLIMRVMRLTAGGASLRRVCGRMTRRMVCLGVSPRA